MELVEAAVTTGLFKGRHFRPDGFTEHWTPVEIVSVEREGWLNIVKARYLESDEREVFFLEFTSRYAHLSPADVVMVKGEELSLFDSDTMRDRRYKFTPTPDRRQ